MIRMALRQDHVQQAGGCGQQRRGIGVGIRVQRQAEIQQQPGAAIGRFDAGAADLLRTAIDADGEAAAEPLGDRRKQGAAHRDAFSGSPGRRQVLW
jgi:hypothetical protein